MKKSLLLTLFTVLLSTAALNAQQTVLYNEDFSSGTIPGTYTLYNVDGRTPDPGLAAVTANYTQWGTNAWIPLIYQDDTAVASTSWYTPAGAANDWLVTPAIALGNAPVLTWDAVTLDGDYPDGYQVVVVTSNTLAALQAATPALTVAAELTTWNTRTLDLSGFAGQTVYIGFRNNSNDKFVLLLDDIKVVNKRGYDAALSFSSFPGEYTMVPLAQVRPLTLSARVSNAGYLPLTNVAVTVDVFKDVVTNNVYTFTSSPAVASLNPNGTTALLATGTYTPTDTGVYYIRYTTVTQESDSNQTNNVAFQYLVVTDSTYARDYAVVTSQPDGALGIGAGAATAGVLGQTYDVYAPSQVTSAEFYLTGPVAGNTVSAVVYSINTTTGKPQTLLATSATYTILPADTEGVYLVLPFSAPVSVAPGTKFFVGVTEGDDNLTLGTTNDVFTTGTTFVNWSTIPAPPGPWANNEAFQFNVTYILRPNLQLVCHTASATSTPATCGATNGSATATTSGGAGPFTYQWSNGGTSDSITNVAAGSYTVTVNGIAGCVATATVFVSNTGGADVELTPTAATCFGSATGSVSSNVTGGTAGYTYLWSNGANTPSIQSVAAGSYTVSVTDGSACVTTATVAVSQPSAISNTFTPTLITCRDESNGALSAAGAGGTGSFSYAWSTGATSAAISSLAAGVYTVTLTDAASCTASFSTSLPNPTLVTVSNTVNDVLCNGGSNGSITAAAQGGTGSFTYSWSTGATSAAVSALSAGTYRVTATDGNGCTASASSSLSNPAAIVAVAECTNTVQGQSTGTATVSAQGGTGTLRYLWSTGGTGSSVSGLAAGAVAVTVTDANGCTALADCEVQFSIGIEETEAGIQRISVYPNPATSRFFVNIDLLQSSDVTLKLYDVTGAVVYTDKLSGSSIVASTVDCSRLAAGMYHLRITTATGTVSRTVSVE